MPGFRPSMVCIIQLTFDETLTLITPPQPVGVEDQLKKLFGPGAVAAKPLFLAQNTKSAYAILKVPKTGSFEKPGYRQAAKFQMTFDYRELPIDPRIVRSASCEIHLGTVSDADFAQGFKGRDATGALKSELVATPANLQMVGMVDEWNVTHDEKGSIAELSGRDFRGILLDTPVDAGTKGVENKFFQSVDMSLPINQTVAKILSFNPAFAQFKVRVNPADWPNNSVASGGASENVARHRLGAKGMLKGGRATPPGSGANSSAGGNLNFWDAIVWVCYRVGAIPYFVGTELHIRPVKTLYDKLRGPIDPERNPTPFAGGSLRSTDTVSNSPITPALQIRKMVYGRDVSRLQFNRKQGGWKRPKTIRAVSSEYDASGNIIFAIWPPQSVPAAHVNRVAPNNQITADDVLTISIAGIKDTTQLQAAAKAVFEEIGRGEMGGVVETKNLSSFGGDNVDPDLLSLNPGDPIELGIDARNIKSGSPLVSLLTNLEQTSFEEAVAAIKAKIPDENLARAVVASTRGQVAELQRYFRVENVKYGWDSSSGVKISFDFQNYVVARSDADAQVAQPTLSGLSVSPSAGGLPRTQPGASPQSRQSGNPAVAQGASKATSVPGGTSSPQAGALPRNTTRPSPFGGSQDSASFQKELDQLNSGAYPQENLESDE